MGLQILNFYNPNEVLCTKGEIILKKKSKTKFIALRADYNNLTIDITSKKNIILHGSLHKFWTNGINHNDFDVNQIFKCLLKLEHELQIDLSLCLVQNLEISINLYNLPLSTYAVICGMIGTKVQRSKHGLVPFTHRDIGNKEGYYIRSKRAQYEFKIYDKALESNLSYQIFRYELKMNKGECIRRFTGVSTLYDLIDPECQKKIKETLIKNWSTILLYDVSLPSKGKHAQYKNYHFWNDLSLNKRSFYYHRLRLLKASKESGSNIHEVISQMLKEKLDQLTTFKKE
ncbi:MAG: hypothetical protein P1U56_26100 [Saprospiraceae bacterium]|nr:hypothetical protein [Saprospiraceae bacterium]